VISWEPWGLYLVSWVSYSLPRALLQEILGDHQEVVEQHLHSEAESVPEPREKISQP
jgi:hypothetical protein